MRAVRLLAKITFTFLCAVFTACAAFGAQITIYHTSDAQGYYYPRLGTGGYAALAGFLAAQPAPYLLFDSGDWASGTFEAARSKGMLPVELMNMAGYTAAAIGNHEGDFGEAAFLALLSYAKFDILAANLSGAGPAVKPYKIYDIAGKKIAVTALARAPLPNSKTIIAGRDISALKKTLAKIKKHSPDAIILLAHSGLAEHKRARSLARLKDIDLVLGGHLHRIEQNQKIGGTIFVESGSDLRGLSRVILDFDDSTGALKDIKSKFIHLDTRKYGQDAQIKAHSQAAYDKTMDAPFATALAAIGRAPKPGVADSALGNLFADIIRLNTGADIALHNSGGLRDGIKKGPLTKRMVFDVYPFENKIILFSVTGDFIKKLLLRGLKEGDSNYQYSGLTLKYTYDDGRARLGEVFIGQEPLEAAKIYTLAVNDFSAQAYPFNTLKGRDYAQGKPLMEMLLEYFAARPAGVKPPPTGRLQKI